MSDARADGTLRLTCQPSKVGNVLIFPYTLENQGSAEVYAVHALPGATAPNETAAIVIAADSGDAIVGKFAAPLPPDRRVWFRSRRSPAACHQKRSSTGASRSRCRSPKPALISLI